MVDDYEEVRKMANNTSNNFGNKGLKQTIIQGTVLG